MFLYYIAQNQNDRLKPSLSFFDMRQTTKEKFPFIASSSGSGDDSEGESNTDSGSGSDAESSNDGGRFIDDQPAWK